MGLISNLRKNFNKAKVLFKASTSESYRRSLQTTLELIRLDQTGLEPNFWSTVLPQQTFGGTVSQLGIRDVQISPSDLYDMIQRDPYYSGLFDQLIEAIFKDKFFIDIAKNKLGKPLGTRKRAKFYESELERIGYSELIQKYIYAIRGDGGGNALLFTVIGPKGLEFRMEPFLDMGRPRVKVYGVDSTRIITRYEIIDTSEQVIWTINPRKDIHFVHLRYSDGGDYRFSGNPAKRAIGWYILKKYIAGSNLSAFQNGLQEPTFMSVDMDAMSKVIAALGTNKVGGSSSMLEQFKRDPLGYIATLGEKSDEILKDLTGNPSRTNHFTRIPIPMKFQAVGRNNKDMKTTELIDLCDKQIGYALRTSKGVLNTEHSKFANAEMERDNWNSFVTNPMKARIEEMTEKYILPVIDPSYNPNIYPVKFGRNPNQEQIDIFRATTERNTAIANILITIDGIPGVKYNFETDQIEPIAETTEEDVETGTGTDIVEEVQGDRALYKKKDSLKPSNSRVLNQRAKTPTEIALDSTNVDKFRGTIRKAMIRQLNRYIGDLERYISLDAAIGNLEQDLTPISQNGLTVTVFRDQLLKPAKIGILEFEKTTGEKLQRAKIAGFNYPDSIIFLMDAKAQLMIKGWITLNNKQKRSITTFYSRDLKKYAGMDAETTTQINTILANTRDEGLGIGEAITRIRGAIPRISLNQAKTISQTETAQAVEATRDNLYTDAGFDEHRWFTVGDNKVRDSHRKNEREGWISITQKFSSGEKSPAEAIKCRCTKSYRRSKKKKT